MNNIRIFLLASFLMIIFSFFPHPLFASDDQTPSGIPLSELETSIDDYVAPFIGNTTAGASVLVLKNHDIVFSKGYGFSAIEDQLPMQPEQTIMEWGSISKLFVYVAAMQLVEEGKLDLEEDITTYLPEDFLTKLSYDKPLTMLHLMHHTAGFEEYIFDVGFGSSDRVTSLEEGLQLAEPHQVYPPGEVVAYSNYSTSLAAYIIECITSEPFYEYVEENIFQPLGMTQTVIHPTFEGNEELLTNKAKGYIASEPAEFIEADWLYMSLYPSGSINGTAENLAAFAQALLPADGEISPLFEKEETLEAFLSQSYTANDQASGIAHGMWEYPGASRGLTHGGNTTSFSSNLHLVPEEDFAVIILTNQAGELDINYGLTALLVGEKDQLNLADNLPSTGEVEGSFLPARRPHHSFISLYFYLMPYHVTTIQENEIQISYAGLTANYRQTSPYVYEMMEGDSFFHSMKNLTFQVEDGKVAQISTAISDYLPYPAGKTPPFLMIHVVLAIICVLFFLICPIILLVKSIKNRKRKMKRMSIWPSILIMSGTATVINVVILAARLLTKYERAYAEIAFQVMLNSIFSGIAIVSMILLAWQWRRARLTRAHKVGYSVSIGMSAMLIALLTIWHFYS
ncbi:serine hydrolase domain-containing protein [Alkalicoccobacillus porphyridii]|nr:serine hydrolase [Alkalicoccobacillus porphyridii]